MSGRLLILGIVAALGFVCGWLILQTSQAAAIIFGLSIALLVVSSFISIRSANAKARRLGGSNSASSSGKLPPHHAVALRQGRAMTRAQEGEVSGLPGGSA